MSQVCMMELEKRGFWNDRRLAVSLYCTGLCSLSDYLRFLGGDRSDPLSSSLSRSSTSVLNPSYLVFSRIMTVFFRDFF